MKRISLSMLVLSCGLLLNSCIKQKYDAPPDTSTYDPALPVQTDLKTLSGMGVGLGSGKWRQMGDTTVYGVIVADDRSGNYYKQIVIEDASGGGIVLYLDKSYLYADYPVGRGVYVKLKGLYLVSYKGLPEIVYSVDASSGTTAPVPSGLIGNYLVRGKFPDRSVSAKEVTLEDVKTAGNSMLNTLVKIKDVQFNAASAGVSYAQAPSMGSGTDRTIEICDHTANIILRTSNYSNFQPYTTPMGFGSVTCIVSNYAGTAQLIIRDTTDVQMTQPRCN